MSIRHKNILFFVVVCVQYFTYLSHIIYCYKVFVHKSILQLWRNVQCTYAVGKRVARILFLTEKTNIYYMLYNRKSQWMRLMRNIHWIIYKKNIEIHLILRNVKFSLISVAFFCLGTEWYQYWLVGQFIINRLPWRNSNLTSSICLSFLRISVCLNMNFLVCPKETDAIGTISSNSFSSSLCSPMWSSPFRYLKNKCCTEFWKNKNHFLTTSRHE